MSAPTIEMAYVALEVSDPKEVATFFTEIIGLAAGDTTSGGELTLTDDEARQRIILIEGPSNDLAVAGFEAMDAPSFDVLVERLTDCGYAPVESDESVVARRRVARLVHLDAPWGGSVEVALGLERGAEIDLPLMSGGFLTFEQGFGHTVVATPAFEASHSLITEGLGLTQSDWIVTEIMDGIELEVRFYHCNERHHSFALARAPFELPTRLHHLMFEANDRTDVGRAFDRAYGSDLAIPNGLGQHDNDRMFSFYVESPAGFQVEVGHGARRIEQPWLDNREYSTISAWGHQPVLRAPTP